ncbi:phosphoenolpyruvate--protein phosphotransferase [Nocardia terpenica]|uniref:Phosphocarrier protein HPr n=1 Tax=Nocardia terpenica TaxID=455432 RepID=A0A291RSJ2_9NOCA|nr:phosphoenolpyruvate--protein phosphotransferase [Nocardia terpenica]ATL70305.1 phosphoenolpyruvate--protein phosphotransferase [Nocardia terpenica]
MIGIVVVSHSLSLAQAAVALAAEMVHGQEVRIGVAAGLDEHTFGTDAVAVAEAIGAADSGDGVLVLMDLGSAVLSAELALELMDSPHEVRLSAAPVIEGLIAAAVSAAGGAALGEAAAEAENALLGKRTQLGGEQEQAAEPPPESTGDRVAAHFVVTNPHGLHARPAARLVAELRGLDAEVRMRNRTTDSAPVSGRSLSRIAALGILAGHEVEITATGPDASTAVDRVSALAAREFDEAGAGEFANRLGVADSSSQHADSSSRRADSSSRRAFGRDLTEDSGQKHAGITSVAASRGGPFPASTGIAIGPARHLHAAEFELPEHPAGSPEQEQERLNGAIALARNVIRESSARVSGAGGAAEAEIFQAHLLLLDDEDLREAVRRRIADGQAGATAWAHEWSTAATALERLPDEYQRARAADVRAVRDQVLAALLGVDAETIDGSGILVAADLTPAQAANLDPAVVAGIVLAQGSPTAHSAILARTRGIPAVVGAGPAVLDIAEGATVALDGATGRLAIDPDPAVLAEFTTRAAEQRERARAAAAAAHEPAVTMDGGIVPVAANVGSLADATAAMHAGADLSGLVRTEFLFLGREHAPSVDEQERMYRQLAEAFGGRRIVLRTLDVGGDKPLPYIAQPREANPFLGLRGLRLALAHPELLRDQLRAIVRVAADHPVSVMFPMVTTVDEVRAARGILEEVLPQGVSLDVGIMVEVPAAAAKTTVLAEHVDFFSIGTNDLTQYAAAVERGNDTVAALADPLDPGVLRLIDLVCRGAGATPVAVCGELAADPLAIPLLLGMGVTELSVAPPAVAATKAAVRDLDRARCSALAVRAFVCESATDVRALVRADRRLP